MVNFYYLLVLKKISVEGRFAQFQVFSYLFLSSVLQPCKHHTFCLGLLRSRPDPVHRGTVEQDRTSQSRKRLLTFCLTRPFKLAVKPVCEWRRASAPASLRRKGRINVYKALPK